MKIIEDFRLRFKTFTIMDLITHGNIVTSGFKIFRYLLSLLFNLILKCAANV